MTDDLATALRTMAESDEPPVMDVERVLHEGRHSLVRRRVATLGGGAAVRAVTALAVGMLAPAGSAGRDGTDSSAAGAAFSVNPNDPVTTHWQFGYVPDGMAAYGGIDTTEEQVSTVLQSENSRFQVELIPVAAPVRLGVPEDGPTEKVSVAVPGTTKAYWYGFGNGRIARGNGDEGQMATLEIQLKSGQWINLIANNVEARADWQDQILRAAAHVVRQDRSVPMPFRLAGAPEGFTFRGGRTMRNNGTTHADLMYRLGPEQDFDTMVGIVAFTTGSEGADKRATCKDSKGLTLCVIPPVPEPAQLTAIGGAQGLLDRVTSLGDDPANWTTDVIR